MCRSKELGGRRCPQHTDPAKHAAYNARRRELYAAKKLGSLESRYNFPEITNDIYDLYKGPQAFENFIVEAVNLENKLSENNISLDERKELMDAIDKYTSFHDAEVKAYLHGTEQEPKTTERAKKIIEGLDKVFELAPAIETPRLLYRGLRVPENISSEEASKWVTENFPVNGIISQKNYMSTTTNGHIAAERFSNYGDSLDDDYQTHQERESVVFEILTTKGIALGEGVSAWDNGEEEVLIPRESRFKVVSMHANKTVSAQVDEIDVQQMFNKTIIRLVDVTNEYKS